ncbi:MAG TPA: DUF6491 family protein [Caulobacteraceae bacterium]|jgi:hypothetical protein|nr:DUF6491 family protein [Caulobacteraceae bacterium]
MIRRALCTLAVAAAALACTSAAPAQPHADTSNANCFRLSMMSDWRPDGDRRLYLRVGVNSFYRVDLAARCASLPYEGNHLVMSPTPGSDLICHPIDLDLKVSENGVREPCFIKSITRLTPEEAAAIPKKAKP